MGGSESGHFGIGISSLKLHPGRSLTEFHAFSKAATANMLAARRLGRLYYIEVISSPPGWREVESGIMKPSERTAAKPKILCNILLHGEKGNQGI